MPDAALAYLPIAYAVGAVLGLWLALYAREVRRALACLLLSAATAAQVARDLRAIARSLAELDGAIDLSSIPAAFG